MDAYLANLQSSLQQKKALQVQVPGNHPYKEFHAIPMVPKANSSCIACGKCAIECPVEAIDPMSLPQQIKINVLAVCAVLPFVQHTPEP